MEVAVAEHIALLVDGAEYFDAFARACEEARRSIIIIGWDFDSRTPLYRSTEARKPTGGGLRGKLRGRRSADAAVRLGDFLRRLTRRRRQLEIRVLIWDYPTLFGLDRDLPLYFGLGRRLPRRIRVRYDSTHPVGASHHQKIIVIDDALAFCGGLDLTMRRWDTCSHGLEEPRRVAFGKPYPPFHDAMMAVSGNAARVLGKVAGNRWRRATGERLHAVTHPDAARWPLPRPPDLEKVAVAVSRTMAASEDQPEVREIERLYVDMIERAESSIYIENQYFTAHRVGEALERRLEEPDGPEVVLILRRLSHGWLEAMSMEALRTRLIRKLKAADRHGRFRVFYPDVAGLAEGTCIDVHSKLMIVDDEILRIGSANLCNRSMGLDSECDLTLEAGGGRNVTDAIAQFRNRLLAEHLDVEPQSFARAHQEYGSLRAAIEALRKDSAQLEPGARTLCELTEVGEISDAVANVVELADPEKPVSLAEMLPLFSPTETLSAHHRIPDRWLGGFFMLLALAAVWRWAPFDPVAAAGIGDWSSTLRENLWLVLAVVCAYLPSGVFSVPRLPVTLFAAAAFGPVPGFVLAMAGSLLAAGLSYLAGTRMDSESLRARVGPGVGKMRRLLRRHEFMAVAAIRLRPFLPFSAPGMLAGAGRVRVGRFVAGTLLACIPGAALASAVGWILRALLDEAVNVSYASVAIAVIAAVAFVGAARAAQRWSSAGDRPSVAGGNLSTSASGLRRRDGEYAARSVLQYSSMHWHGWAS